MNEAETYTRDHLLIEFMLENYSYSSCVPLVEKVYKEWLTWLNLLKLRERKEKNLVYAIKEDEDGSIKKGSEV